ncbi:restriction endonuclease subunit S [Methanobrevibacter sp.]|uniref:restriction endonuclease subunit S n=1 Tax=Methanobrevibacter sp. TaxID=66852 RepID=UPI0038647646
MSLDKSQEFTEDWEWVKAKDFMLFNPRESVKKGTIVKNVPMDKIEPKTKEIPSFEITEYNGGVKFRNGDTLMARITPCLENGKISQVSILDNNEVGAGSTEFIVLREKEGVSDKDFIYYLSNSEYFKEPAIKSMVGSSGRQRVQRDVVENLDIFVPPLDTQKKIGKLLSLFDKKITLNKEINNHLENYVKYTFNSYFNKFLPFQEQKFVDSEYGFIPEGWQIGQIGDYCSIKSGFAFKSKWWQEDGIKVIKIKDINQGSIDFSDCSCVSEENTSKANEFKVQGGDLLIAMTGATLGKFSVVPKTDESLYVNQRVGKFFLGDNPLKSLPFIWGLLNQRRIHDEIINRGQGSAQPNVSPTDIMTIEIILPPKSVIDMFNTKFQPVFNLIINNMYEIDKLSKLRDVLLPKLMSGEINVSQVNYDLE